MVTTSQVIQLMVQKSSVGTCTTIFIRYYLGGGFKYFFIFTPKIGEDSHIDEHIFQMGWFNHQPVIYIYIVFLDDC